jgi:hypothetical protein
MNEADKEEFRKMIKDTLYETEPAICKIESMRMAQLETTVKNLSILVAGNGHVEDSILWKTNKNVEELGRLAAIIERRRLNDAGERDTFNSFVRYLVDKIIPSLVTTAILGLIAFQFAVSQHMIITTP